jgi:glycosyltransferase involved in cell wall biosynthesis
LPSTSQEDSAAQPIELSVVIPCLNEADTLGFCLEQVFKGLKSANISGEVVVADNGSSDGSAEIARSHGARVVSVEKLGYGSALIAGIAASRGKFVIMGDADGSYDFLEIPKFIEKLREGFDLVQGCRFPSGGGTILPGAMPLLHRWLGNPMFSRLARWWFKSPIHDAYCGLRGFTRAHYESLQMSSMGMVFAVEMVIKSSLYGARIAELPITLHPDRRQGRLPHLRTFRDGWRTLRFFLLYSPSMLFMLPGSVLILLGAVAYGLAMPGVSIGPMTFDAHTLLFGSLFLISGYQSILFGSLITAYERGHGLLPESLRSAESRRAFSLERGLTFGGLMMLIGVLLLGVAVNTWRVAEFGSLDYASTMRWVVPGVTLASIGFQSVLCSFGMGVLLLGKEE